MISTSRAVRTYPFIGHCHYPPFTGLSLWEVDTCVPPWEAGTCTSELEADSNAPRGRLILVLLRWGLIVDYGRLRNEALLGNVTLRRDVARIRNRGFRHVVVHVYRTLASRRERKNNKSCAEEALITASPENHETLDTIVEARHLLCPR
jgi:hypothetical protein